MRAIVIGIDGASWDVLTHNSLVNSSDSIFTDIAQGESSGDLISTIPPVTGPAWVSLATGSNPGQHGCFGFLLPGKDLSISTPINSRNIACLTFYEILEKVGKRSILINLPCSYPPRISGAVITSLMTGGDRFVFPADLADEYDSLKKYRPFPDMRILARGKMGDYLEDIRDVERRRFEAAVELIQSEWDFFFVLISAMDWALHSIDGGIDDAARNRSVQKIYRDVQEYLAWFVENCPKDAFIILVSDHGFRDYTKTFYPNVLLKEEGFLRLAESEDYSARPHRLFDEYTSDNRGIPVPRKLASLAKRSPRLMGLAHRIKNTSPVKLSSPIHLVPDPSSKAACLSPGMSNYGTVYVPENTESRLKEIRENLLGVKDSQSGKNIVTNTWSREELYHGKSVALGPHIIFETRKDCWINNDLTYPQMIGEKSRPECNHDIRGMYAVIHKTTRSGSGGERSITDIAPTILANYGLPVPDWMDGRPIFRAPRK